MNQTYPIKPALITGICTAITAIGFFTVFNSLSQHFGWGINPVTIRGISGLVTIIVLGTGIYMGMQGIKKQNGGVLSYKQALLSGITVALITGVTMAVFAFVYCTFINPGNAAYMIAESKKAMIAKGDSPASINAQVTALQKQLSTSAQVIQGLVGQSVVGTLISLVMALFVRSKK